MAPFPIWLADRGVSDLGTRPPTPTLERTPASRHHPAVEACALIYLYQSCSQAALHSLSLDVSFGIANHHNHVFRATANCLMHETTHSDYGKPLNKFSQSCIMHEIPGHARATCSVGDEITVQAIIYSQPASAAPINLLRRSFGIVPY
jgi:hypothetical protein